MAQENIGNQVSDISAQNNRVNEEATAWLDSVSISLLTCGPGQEVWSYYGHTALRIEDKAHGTDVAVNWGMFSFRQSFFVLRFVFGLTDYQIGIYPMSDFLTEYAAEGRWVKQQRLRLSRNEKLNILRAIDENARPENRTYRYNFFFDNCTTRAREMILDNIGTSNTNFRNVASNSTYREEIHRFNNNHRWARFGNDLLLGYGSDKEISKREWEFLPNNLSQDFETEGRKDFSNSPIEADDNSMATTSGGYVTLVDSSCFLIPANSQVEKEAEGTITPIKVAWLIATLIIATSIFEVLRRKNLWGMDAFLFVATGLPGLILLAMIFSQHPTVQINYQILILNPLNLFFAWKTIKKLKKGKLYWYYDVWGILLFVGILLGIFQDYAEGMYVLAFSLLIRYIIKSTIAGFACNKFTPGQFIGKKFKRNNKIQKKQ